MSQFRRLLILGACALPFAPRPVAAESQSSDSSSDCSNGRCTRVDRHTVEDRNGRRTTVRRESWREDDDGGRRGQVTRGRRRDDDDDDDDD
jgi:hypothetical protein